MNTLEVKIEGQVMVIRIPMNPEPTASASGKTLVVASTHGNQTTTTMINGKPVVLGLNAYIRR